VINPALMHSANQTAAEAEEVLRIIGDPLKNFDTLVEQLVRLSGYDKSERDSEVFLEQLASAVSTVKREVKYSHKQGLSFDCTHALSQELFKRRDEKTTVQLNREQTRQFKQLLRSPSKREVMRLLGIKK
jgi:hypothetical protein